MTKSAFLAVVFLLVLASADRGYASPLTVDVLRTEYVTLVEIQLFDSTGPTTTDSRTTISSQAIHDSMLVPVTVVRPGEVGAIADADLFSVYAESSSVPWGSVNYALASARTVVEFTPLQGGLATIDVDFAAQAQGLWAEGFVSLFNMSSNQYLWSYGWDWALPIDPSFTMLGTVPWNAGDAALSLPTSLNANDRYSLTMYTRTSANFDSQGITMKVSGLQSVPEPSVLLSVVLGMSGVGLQRWRSQRRRLPKSSGEQVSRI